MTMTVEEAEIALALVDADVARWFVNDGALSEEPLEGRLSAGARLLRMRRLKAVADLEAAGGHDPHPSLLSPPTDRQREGWAERQESEA